MRPVFLKLQEGECYNKALVGYKLFRNLDYIYFKIGFSPIEELILGVTLAKSKNEINIGISVWKTGSKQQYNEKQPPKLYVKEP